LVGYEIASDRESARLQTLVQTLVDRTPQACQNYLDHLAADINPVD
jgi:hypothetical protein